MESKLKSIFLGSMFKGDISKWDVSKVKYRDNSIWESMKYKGINIPNSKK